MILKFVKYCSVLLLLSALSSAAAGYAVQFSDEGRNVRVRWKNNVIPIAVSQSLTKQIQGLKTDADTLNAVKKCLSSWEKAADVKFQVTLTDKNSVGAAGKKGDGVNLITIAETPENVLPFNAGNSEDTAARTQIFYNGKGFITEADIVLNPYQQFSTDGAIGTFDLESTLTHEIGHLLGLEHSPIPGATMFEHQGKNGIYGLSNFAPRSLSDDDLTAVRALYPPKNPGADCCGGITGKILTANGKASKNIRLWLEETETGRVVAGSSTGADGGFRFDGLAANKYSIYAQEETGGKSAAGQLLGETEVVKGKSVSFSRKLKSFAKTFDVSYIGFNGQLLDLAIPLNGGGSFLIYVGGTNLDAEKLKVGFNSTNFSVVPNTVTRQDFGNEISVISFEVRVNPETPFGEYSFFLRGKNDETVYAAGVLTVDEFVNSWSNRVFSDKN